MGKKEKLVKRDVTELQRRWHEDDKKEKTERRG